MAYKTFNSWLFDSNIKSEIPSPKYEGDEVTVDLLKYNSPINQQYILKLFLRNPSLNFYLNFVFNNSNLWYIDKKEFFFFIKKCVQDFRVNRNSLMFYPKTTKHVLFDALQNKLPMLKKDDLSLLCEKIEKLENKDELYSAFGFEKPKKEKLKDKIKKVKKEKLPLKDFIKNNFSYVEAEIK